MILRLLRIAPVAVTSVLVLAFALHGLWAYIEGARKLTQAEIEAAQRLSGSAQRLNLRVVLSFEPEQFHFLWLQNFGRMAGADETSVSLRGVTPADARSLARQYWIQDLEPLEPL